MQDDQSRVEAQRWILPGVTKKRCPSVWSHLTWDKSKELGWLVYEQIVYERVEGVGDGCYISQIWKVTWSMKHYFFLGSSR